MRNRVGLSHWDGKATGLPLMRAEERGAVRVRVPPPRQPEVGPHPRHRLVLDHVPEEGMTVVTGRNDRPPIQWPEAEPYLGQSMRFWIEVLHRRSVADAERMNRIEERPGQARATPPVEVLVHCEDGSYPSRVTISGRATGGGATVLAPSQVNGDDLDQPMNTDIVLRTGADTSLRKPP